MKYNNYIILLYIKLREIQNNSMKKFLMETIKLLNY